ncbi:PREDICTED: tripartite motif-containing protein 5-like [Galeopterus variegatus]|uniref:Tripartite motif-containing protein 5-like n=1 Tax=Galeopterus variegatus TaxID=482537 RepID=A0ABM0Q3L3_GALVR|nr:PREDICTED: tripartite motif-containing protein 5-like [Galeopterus variegatus]XP_008588695.1 PREDICTED: tripartite motif-containing protein 5-like [Galeopterus variegatus]
MLQALKELTDMQLYWVDMKLTPRKNSNTFNFFNPTQVEFSFEKCSAPANSSSNDYYSIGGSPLMTSGQHYWEVDVSNKSAWILGVCEVKDLQWLVRNCFTQVVSYQPRHGYWVIGLKNQVEYTAFQDSSSNDPLIVTLFLPVPPWRIGVFLDYDAGTLYFFNVTNGFLIYKFSSCRFSPMVCPYFNPINCSVPMTLCSPSL